VDSLSAVLDEVREKEIGVGRRLDINWLLRGEARRILDGQRLLPWFADRRECVTMPRWSWPGLVRGWQVFVRLRWRWIR
jgi:hypothetical protein